MTTEELIARLGLTSAPHPKGRVGISFHLGHTAAPLEAIEDLARTAGFGGAIEQWSDGRYRSVWVNVGARALFTYCEGDLSLEECQTDRVLGRLIAYANAFYRRMR